MLKGRYERRIAELEKTVRQQRERIEQQERIIEMFSQAGELSRQERLSAEQMIQAQQSIGELAAKERQQADEIISAQERIHQLAEDERREAEGLLTAHDKVEKLSVDEIKQRDAILASILEVNEHINRLQPAHSLLERTLKEATELLQTRKGLIAIREYGNLTVKVRHGFEPDDDCSSILDVCRAVLEQKQTNGVTNGKKHKKNAGSEYLACPLSREDRPYGVIFLEEKENNLFFSSLDREFLEIFASQVSLALNNSLLYNRVRMQNRELKRMIMLKNNFIDHLSKDFKKPLMQISDVLEKNGQKEEAREKIAILLRMIDKIISISALKKEAEEMFSHKIEVRALIEEILETLEQEIEKKQLTVRIDEPSQLVPFEGNREILTTILDEVICNAVVYNKEGGKVQIELEQEEQKLHIKISDTGIGIPDVEQAKVFERFFRSQGSYDTYKRGAGLGLYIVKSFVETYGGKISLTSASEQGTTVMISLPM